MKSFYQLRCFYPLGKLALFVKDLMSQNLSIPFRLGVLSPSNTPLSSLARLEGLAGRAWKDLFCIEHCARVQKDAFCMTSYLEGYENKEKIIYDKLVGSKEIELFCPKSFCHFVYGDHFEIFIGR
jgi:hypothetical protein